MLTNEPIRPVAHDLDRRWLFDDYFDLIVWYESEEQIHGFQLCYDKIGCQRALTWTRKQGFRHAAIDSGDSKPTANRTPILVADGIFPVEEVRNEFIARSKLLPLQIRELILARIKEYESCQHR
ncbi:MAG: hypothetical protein PHD76_13525 [Methylacidiphilales bacterium]|nr:hypothetical protein [Candidatus Methylacidiphilales bacterium]